MRERAPSRESHSRSAREFFHMRESIDGMRVSTTSRNRRLTFNGSHQRTILVRATAASMRA